MDFFFPHCIRLYQNLQKYLKNTIFNSQNKKGELKKQQQVGSDTAVVQQTWSSQNRWAQKLNPFHQTMLSEYIGYVSGH